jgi:putative addiction module killer protein/probable addiction module antidote protein
VIEIRRYVTRTGKDVIGDWLAGLDDAQARARIAARIDRLSLGNFGDCKPLREGVSELRIDWGPGYRMYYAMLGRTCVLLLCGGDKRKQSSDVNRAIEYLQDHKERGTQVVKHKASISHDEAMVRELRENPNFAAEYLRAALEDEDEPRVLLIALRREAVARGGIAKVAKAAGVERESLYRALSAHGNPRLSTLVAVTKAMGLKLTVEAGR